MGGRIRLETNLSARTIAIWQVDDGVLNRWRPGEEYTVVFDTGHPRPLGDGLFNRVGQHLQDHHHGGRATSTRPW